ncbi:MAG: ABC transporter substrate-binding protein [Verrucomicrobiota bacterium]
MYFANPPMFGLRSIPFAIVALTIGSLLVASCQPSKPSVKIGINAELTGEMPAVGASCKQAAELFAEQVNRDGGIMVGGTKIPVELSVVDNSCKADQSAAAAQRLISQNGVLVMVGPDASSCAIPAGELAESLGCLMISPWSTNPKTTQDTQTGKPKKNVFRACFTDRFESPVLAAFATKNLHAKTAAVLYDVTSEAPTSQSALFKEAFEKAGGKVVSMETYSTGDRDFSAQLTKIRESAPDIIYLPAPYNDTPLIAAQARQLGIKAPFLGSDAWSSPDIIKLDTGKNLEGSYFCNHYSTEAATPKAKQFIADYTARYGNAPDDVAALTYDAMGLASQSISSAGKVDRTAVRDAMAATRTFEGVTGHFVYPEGARDPEKSAVIMQIKDGSFHWVSTVDP